MGKGKHANQDVPEDSGKGSPSRQDGSRGPGHGGGGEKTGGGKSGDKK